MKWTATRVKMGKMTHLQLPLIGTKTTTKLDYECIALQKLYTSVKLRSPTQAYNNILFQ